MILDMLKQDGEFKALTSAARATKTMYDIAIPKIYETVVVNERNRSTIGYGHGTGASGTKQGKTAISEYWSDTYIRSRVYLRYQYAKRQGYGLHS